MGKSKIEWTDRVWNPVVGCRGVSAGCANCYARRMAGRLRAMGVAGYGGGFEEVRVRTAHLEDPLRWKKGCRIFVNSMGDLFYEKVPDQVIRSVFEVMTSPAGDRHVFQVLTKRPLRMAEYAYWDEPNIWAGVSVEDSAVMGRLHVLRASAWHRKWVSFEPLIGRVGVIDLTGIGWVVCGGESGPGARPCEADWVREIRDQASEAGVPFFFKQWGGVRRTAAGRVLDGRTWEELPSGMKV